MILYFVRVGFAIMTRPLRVQYPGAWYHVMNRGRRGETVFSDKQDYLCFVDLLKETSDKWGIRISAYCLMPNHYHLLVQTPLSNISRGMRHLNGIYTQRYNRHHGCDGQLFRGRYKSILVEEDVYLLRLLRYIHRNPLRAGLVQRIEDYEWSSHHAYLSHADEWSWVYKGFILSMFTRDRGARLDTYKQFMAEEDEELNCILERKKWPSFLAKSDFAERIKDRFSVPELEDEIPQAKEWVPSTDRIIKIVSKFYDVEEDVVYFSKRGYFNEPRGVAIYLVRRLRRDTLRQICNVFSINKYSSVSSVIERLEKRMKQDARLRENIDKLITLTKKSQEQT